jgi:heptosyltransferase III
MSGRAIRPRRSTSSFRSLLNRRLLAIRPGGLGDCILSFPAMESLRSRCEYLEVWVPGAVVPLVRFADRVRSLTSTGIDLLGVVTDELEALHGFDAIVSWYGTNRDEFRETVRGFPFEFHAALPEANNGFHACDFFCSQVGAGLGFAPFISEARELRGFLAIHPFSGSPKKNWPIEQFEAIADRFDCEWCATPEQSGMLKPRHSPLLAVNDLGTVARWLAEARAYVGNDSGITHLAAAVGTPVAAIFGPSDPRIWAPRGRRVETLESPDVDEVFAAIRQFM